MRFLFAPEFCLGFARHGTKAWPPESEGRRSADRRGPAAHRSGGTAGHRTTRVRTAPNRCGARLALRRARLAALRGGSRRSLSALAQSGPALHGSGQPVRSPGSQLLADRRRGRPGGFPNRPRAVCETAPGTALAPLFGSHPDSVPSASERRRFYSTRAACQASSPIARQRPDSALLFAPPLASAEATG